MYVLNAARQKIELDLLDVDLEASVRAAGARGIDAGPVSLRVAQVARAFFKLSDPVRAAEMTRKAQTAPGTFRERESGLMRVVYKDAIIRFRPKVSEQKRKQILKKYGFELRVVNPFVERQWVVTDEQGGKSGANMLDVTNDWAEMEEVEFASPSFVSEFQRYASPPIPKEQWHLDNLALVAGQKKEEDVRAKAAWAKTLGKKGVVVAVLDDGVDVEHPNLAANILKNPDPTEKRDKCGRDFFIPDDEHPEHYDPRPKLFQYPYHKMAGNDIHGTPCAGIIAAVGKKRGWAVGVAPKCRILPVKIFHADALASDARVADAIRYAASHADILSCSWTGPDSPDIQLAIQDAQTLGRAGKGSAVFCATGNNGLRRVGYPARYPESIGVGASTDAGKIASYSNYGPEVWVSAPSSGGSQGIFTTDVSIDNRGFNIGTVSAGGKDGLHTNDFGGTSAATPLAAGVAALVLSKKPALSRGELKQLLADTADKIGTDHDSQTDHSERFGYGRVNAERALAAL
jgi:subtilisin family serine protease